MKRPVKGENIHVIGAGLAGLSAATALAEQGRRVLLYEASPQAGGRCRSYLDTVMNRYIDNGNHLFLSGNRAINTYVARLGSGGMITGPNRACFPFMDRESSRRWVVDAGAGRLPWPLLQAENRSPDSTILDFLAVRRLLTARNEDTVAALMADNKALYNALWEPLAVAILNTPPDEASAALLGAVLRQAFRGGAKTCLPRLAGSGLSEVFVNPALKYLRDRGTSIGFNERLNAMEFEGGRVSSLTISGKCVPIPVDEQVILAVPPWSASPVLPGVSVPARHCGIINGHFVLPRKTDKLTIMGLINGDAHWIFVRGDVASVTISAVSDRDEYRLDELAHRLWGDICVALNMENTLMGAHRIISEKRATISHDPENCALRPQARTAWPNLTLAGDWTYTGLPATIEGAVQPGATAATLVSGALT